MTTVVISQPMYFGWPGFIGHMSIADTFIWLDDAQFSKGSYTNRIQVKTASGRNWMTIPLAGKGAFQQIGDLAASDANWRGGHRDLLRQQLKGAPHLNEALALFDEAVAKEPLVDALIASAELPAAYLGVRPATILRSSTMGVSGQSSRRVLDLVLAARGTRYVTGHGAARYLDHALFESAGVSVDYMDYDIEPWAQAFGAFTPYVTILDPIANIGRATVEHLPTGTTGWREFIAERETAHG